MNDFRQHFLLESVKKLQTLITVLAEKQSLSDSDKKEIFRTLHTIKGTSQTFGFDDSSRLAHELESLLSINKDSENSVQKLIEGLKILKNSFSHEDFEISEDFLEKLSELPSLEKNSKKSERNLTVIPKEISELLSAQEKNTLYEELEKGKNLFCVEIGFEISSFSAGFKNFRENLSNSGEIIATFPSQKFAKQGKIGFQILLASLEKTSQIRKIAEKFSAEIVFDNSAGTSDFDIQEILKQVISHAEKTAESLGKTVEFEISVEESEISKTNLNIIFDVLLHLIRNSVDHAFETKGKISITLKSVENGLNLYFSDDGRGIEPEKIRAKSAEKELSDENAIELIFQSGFSTAQEITKISGRGVGLDAVKNAIEKVDGEIKVKSNLNEGTFFEIFLPENE